MKTLFILFTSSLIFSIIFTPLSAQVDGSNTVNTTTANPVEGAFWNSKGDFGKACKEAYQTGKISSINLVARYVILTYEEVMLGSFKDGEVADHNIGLREFPPGTIFVQEVATGKICLAQCANEMDVLRPQTNLEAREPKIIKVPEPVFYQCWDIDTNGVNDPTEDINQDGVFNYLDCRETVEVEKLVENTSKITFYQCWDIDTNGVADSYEDRNGDGEVNGLDCIEVIVFECWDKNKNGVRDDFEDKNKDGYITDEDCIIFVEKEKPTISSYQNTNTPHTTHTKNTQPIQYVEAASVPVGQSYFQEKVQANGYYKVTTKTQNCNCIVY